MSDSAARSLQTASQEQARAHARTRYGAMEQIIPTCIADMERATAEAMAEIDENQMTDCNFLTQQVKQIRARLEAGELNAPGPVEVKKAKTLEDIELPDDVQRVRVRLLQRR